jgi:hypothetical protein
MVPKYCFRLEVTYRQMGAKQPQVQHASYDHLNDAIKARDRFMGMKNVKRVTVLTVIDELEKWDASG